MTVTDYILDISLIAIVFLQLRWSRFTAREMLRPLIIMAVAISIYFRGFSLSSDGLILTLSLLFVGVTLGSASGAASRFEERSTGVWFKAGKLSAALWVLGMGSRFGFILWITHSGQGWMERFSMTHALTEVAWTNALLGMAFGEVVARTVVLTLRGIRAKQGLVQKPELAIA